VLSSAHAEAAAETAAGAEVAIAGGRVAVRSRDRIIRPISPLAILALRALAAPPGRTGAVEAPPRPEATQGILGRKFGQQFQRPAKSLKIGPK